MFDLIIIGGGPAAMSAGIYAARKKLKTLLLAEEIGGQSSVSPEIQNWIGEISVSGIDLVKKIEAHLRHYEGESLVVKTSSEVVKVAKTENGFSVVTKSGENYESKTILVASGGRKRKLEIKGADVFEHKGLTYCASCDGPLFSGQDVAVIGGGNAGFGTAGQLLAYCQSVTLLEMAPTFRAEQVTIDKLSQDPKFKALNNVELLEIKGNPSIPSGQANFVKSLAYKNKTDDKITELPISGIFVEIGFLPNTELVKGLLDLSPQQGIIVDHNSQRASLAGVWAAGDCTDNLYHQNNIAAGDAVKAVENIYDYLKSK